MTVKELRDMLQAELTKTPQRGSWPVVVQFAGSEGYMKATATSVQFIHDYMPDGEGGDDIHNPGFIMLIEAITGDLDD